MTFFDVSEGVVSQWPIVFNVSTRGAQKHIFERLAMSRRTHRAIDFQRKPSETAEESHADLRIQRAKVVHVRDEDSWGVG